MNGARGPARKALSQALVIEMALLLMAVASVVLLVWQFLRDGYLHQPFIFDTNDTFMDWFNTAYWANHPGAYDVWRSIYPPLSFVFLKLFSLGGCYADSPFHGRDCDWLGRLALFAFYLLDIVLAWIAFSRMDRRTAWLRATAFAIGLPMLFALERGNLVVPCMTFFIIAYADLSGPRWKALSFAMTVNFKPYLLLPVLTLAIRRQWRVLELAGIATLALYLLTWAMVGSGSMGELVGNARNWVTFVGGQVWEQIYYSTSYATLAKIQESPFPILRYLPSRTVETIYWIVPIVIHSSQALALLCFVGAWLQPTALPLRRLAAIAIGASLVSQSPGGYTQIFLIFLVFLEPWRRPGPVIALICAYLLSISADWVLTGLTDVSLKSWLGGRTVSASFGLATGQFVRPGLIVLILWALALDSLAQIVRAHGSHRPQLGLSNRLAPA
jgi:hypothetical protein